MNILYLTTHLNIGGISSYLLSLSRGLRDRGHNIYIASASGSLLQRFISEGVKVIPIPIKTKSEISPGVILSLFILLKRIKQADIDIIHANTRVTQVLAHLIYKFSGRPYISTCHGFFKTRFFRRIFPCWGLKVIAVSEQVGEHLVKDFKLKKKQVRVIPHGIDVGRFLKRESDTIHQIKSELGLKDGPVIGIIARLSDIKGHVYLIEAMKTVLNTIADAQLLIIGEGRMKEKLVDLTKRLGINQSIFFLPAVMDTADILSVIDVFVMPSLNEGLGLGVMEAMASGIAVVGSDVGGMRSLIRDGYNGILVKPADPDSLSSVLSNLLKDQDRRNSLGRNAHLFIEQNFSQDKMVLETERIYLECLSAKY